MIVTHKHNKYLLKSIFYQKRFSFLQFTFYLTSTEAVALYFLSSERKNFPLMILETLVYEERHYNNSVIEIGILGMCFLNVQFLYLHFHLLSVFMTELEYICIEKYYTYVIIGKSSSHTSLEVSVG